MIIIINDVIGIIFIIIIIIIVFVIVYVYNIIIVDANIKVINAIIIRILILTIIMMDLLVLRADRHRKSICQRNRRRKRRRKRRKKRDSWTRWESHYGRIVYLVLTLELFLNPRKREKRKRRSAGEGVKDESERMKIEGVWEEVGDWQTDRHKYTYKQRDTHR